MKKKKKVFLKIVFCFGEVEISFIWKNFVNIIWYFIVDSRLVFNDFDFNGRVGYFRIIVGYVLVDFRF